MKRYLFVSGCPRSGTTALTTLLNWAPQTFVGQERYNMLFNKDNSQLRPGLFDPERLRSFRDTDCGYTSYDQKPAYFNGAANLQAIENMDQAQVVGDKLISLWRNFSVFNAPHWANKDIQVIHIIRDVHDVAASYQARYQNAADGWQDDFSKGVRVWSQSVRNVATWIKAHEGQAPSFKLHLVSYEGLFENDKKTFADRCADLYRAISLDVGASQMAGFAKMHSGAERVQKRRISFPELNDKIAEIVDHDTLQMQSYLRQQAIF
ncbi:hypothetical protein C1J03_00230 [Sulfitobacter sp. SK012]|uniref:sulfotransferase n=1 Tax=Sulfitobacter sp. SK012 TaxID=1389005 RepID=UPI000E0B45DD|nr:sulfotransferase [Sulfitobacter sp. SK012]AXI44591.1 hypothetical protein C1J03_00230 [Sulfitobacter sp. SK012]